MRSAEMLSKCMSNAPASSRGQHEPRLIDPLVSCQTRGHCRPAASQLVRYTLRVRMRTLPPIRAFAIIWPLFFNKQLSTSTTTPGSRRRVDTEKAQILYI